MKLPPVPKWAVPVRVPFTDFVLSGACSPEVAWRPAHGAKTSPLQQNLVLHRVKEWKKSRDRRARKYLGPLYRLFEPDYVVEVRTSCRIPVASNQPDFGYEYQSKQGTRRTASTWDRGDQSHIDFESATGDLSYELGGVKPEAAPHTTWQLLEHMRIAQHDILEFSEAQNTNCQSGQRAIGPKIDAPRSEKAWTISIASFQKEAHEMEIDIGPKSRSVQDNRGWFWVNPVSGGLLLAVHNSYHLGQLVLLKKILLGET